MWDGWGEGMELFAYLQRIAGSQADHKIILFQLRKTDDYENAVS